MGVNEEEDVVADGRTDEGVEAKDKAIRAQKRTLPFAFSP